MAKAKIGDKIRIVNAYEDYSDYYTNGAEGFVVHAHCSGDVTIEFTYGWLDEDDDSREFYVCKEEYEVISNESKTQTKKEKEMEDKITLKQGVYAVVETGSKSVVDVFTNRGAARYWMQGMKQEFPECSYKLAKLSVDKWIR